MSVFEPVRQRLARHRHTEAGQVCAAPYPSERAPATRVCSRRLPEEPRARARKLELRAAGWSLRQIAGELDVGGMTLSHVGVRRVLNQETARIAAELHFAYNRCANGLELRQNGREAP
ncbi:hypothetical protein BH23PSE1_BH23PSE1_05520 [soil metagenome]